MKKYIVGAFFGFILAFTLSAHADVVATLIGKAVQGEFPVKIDGQTLDNPAIVIDGTSYLPNRAIANALNMDISFNADLGIELKKKEVATVTTMDTTTNATTNTTPTVTDAVYDLQTIDFNIRRLNNFNIDLNENIKEYPDSPKLAEWQAQLKQYQDELALWEARKAALPTTP